MSQIKYQIRYALPVWFLLFITNILPDNKFSIRIRGLLVSIILPNKPKNLTLGRDITLLGIDKLFIGEGVYIAKGTWINALGRVEIEDKALISPYVIIASVTHGFNGDNFYGPSTFSPIRLGKGCWLASHVTVTSGVHIAPKTLVGANSCVIKNTEFASFYSGVPAKKIIR
ncbi:acyltransferase [Thalassotalea nanhaiensis]|uniref:Acyltransferase n=1 Tax=Thalassotalea nanhaiensis TaxID=3065648 RepID=A0ABY9TL56_9GAMM|nr:acyltransferase [Colwelliaceae bacterium SQ345]